MKSDGSRGFTLLEVIIVVVIVGVLAAIVIAEFVDAAQDVERTAFIESGHTFVTAAARYHLDTGSYPSAPPGVVPAGLENYVRAEQFLGPTPIGGVWDTSVNAFGVTASMGVFYAGPHPNRNDAYMQEIDALIDDGDLSTGMFRKMSNQQYFFVVEE